MYLGTNADEEHIDDAIDYNNVPAFVEWTTTIYSSSNSSGRNSASFPAVGSGAGGGDGGGVGAHSSYSSQPSSAAVVNSILQSIYHFWLNASGIFSRHQEMLSWLLNGPLSLLFVLSGIVLNALCVVVFLRFRRNVSGGTTPIIHYYLISLAGWHSALLFNAFLLYCLPTMLWGSVISSGPYVHLYPPTYTLANATHTGTVWIILALTLDRYLALCMPFKHRIFSKRSRVKRLVVGLSVGALFFCLPRFFEVQTAVECYTGGGAPSQHHHHQHPAIAVAMIDAEETNATIIMTTNATVVIERQQQQQQHQPSDTVVMRWCTTYVQRTGLPENQLYRTIYHILLGSAFVTILPGVLTFVLTLRISIALGEARRRRKRLSHCCNHFLLQNGGTGSATTRTTMTTMSTERESLGENVVAEKQQYRMVLLSGAMGTNGGKKPSLKRREHRANVMLVVIIVKFLISDILPTVLDVFETFIGNEVFMASPLATLWVDFSNFLLVINCSTNFWVFLLYVRGFRQRCARLITNSFQFSTKSPQIDEATSGVFGGSCIASLRPSTPRFSANGGSITLFGGGQHQRLHRGSGGGEFGDKSSVTTTNNNNSNSQQNANFGVPNLNEALRKEKAATMDPFVRQKRASSLAISVQSHQQQRHNTLGNGTVNAATPPQRLISGSNGGGSRTTTGAVTTTMPSSNNSRVSLAPSHHHQQQLQQQQQQQQRHMAIIDGEHCRRKKGSLAGC